MKKILTLSVTAMVALAAFSGCTKTSTPALPSYTMSATIGGKAYTSALCIVSTIGSNTIEINAETTTAGTAVTYPFISIYLGNTTLKAGNTYSLDSTLAGNYAEIITSDSTLPKIAASGTVTITSASSDAASGTFSFTCTDGTVVTGGKFNGEEL